jgi:hypothetical protein
MSQNKPQECPKTNVSRPQDPTRPITGSYPIPAEKTSIPEGVVCQFSHAFRLLAWESKLFRSRAFFCLRFRPVMITDNGIMRTIVDKPEGQLAMLGAWCERDGISRAEAIRRALDAILPQKQAGRHDASFGSWKPRGNNRAPVRTLRGEWEQ